MATNYPTPKLSTIIAIDPGVSGAVAVLNRDGIHCFHMPTTDELIAELVRSTVADANAIGCPAIAVIEQVNGFMGNKLPGSRMFTMGENYGFIRGALKAIHIPVTMVPPRKWQGDLAFVKGKMERPVWKRHLCLGAKALYPQLRITQQDADAILLLHWARLSMDYL